MNKKTLLIFIAIILITSLPIGCISNLCQQRDTLEQSYPASKYPYVIDTHSGYVYCKSYEILESGNIVAIDYYELDGRILGFFTGEVTIIESSNLISIDRR